MTYGLPYMGSKSRIAKDIIDILPRGKRLVDLFGGGGAITHCGALSGKYRTVLYNDINTLLVEWVEDVIAGKYASGKFLPRFVSKKEFVEKRDTDAYIKYVFSFGNNGRDYYCNPQMEATDKSIIDKDSCLDWYNANFHLRRSGGVIQDFLKSYRD